MPGALQLEAMAQMLTVAITTQEGLAGGVAHALERYGSLPEGNHPRRHSDHRSLCRQLEAWHL